MNLKDAFRVQNKLQSVMLQAMDILEDRQNILKVRTTHLRSKVMADDPDVVVSIISLASSWVRLSSMYAVNWFSASRSLNMFSAFTATRVKEPMMSRQQIIMQTAAKDIKP